jgi:hypothetical protein
MLPVFMDRFHIQKNDIKSVYVLEFYLAGIISIGNRWLQNGREIKTEELGALIRGLLTEGVLNTLDLFENPVSSLTSPAVSRLSAAKHVFSNDCCSEN